MVSVLPRLIRPMVATPRHGLPPPPEKAADEVQPENVTTRQ